MPHTPTPEQQSIIETVSRGNSSLMISAYAGTAKSTTLEMAAPGVRGYALALAFNKKIADELKGRLPDNFHTRTLNGLGHLALMRALNLNSVKIDAHKLGKIVTALSKQQRAQLASWQWEAIRDGVTAAMQAGLSPGDIGHPLVADTEEAWREFLDFPDDLNFPLMYRLAKETLKASIDLVHGGQISFDDQIYFPTIINRLGWPRYPTVFVDEAQDLSPLNHVQLQLCSTNLINAVGDPYQAIYAFRGADSSSMTNLRKLRPEWTDRRLTLTFRCPSSIVARQTSHAPGYTAAPSNAEGHFLEIPPINEVTGEGGWSYSTIRRAQERANGNTAAILCRNNAPLLSLAFKLISRGIGCRMLGRDIGKGLIQLSRKICPSDETPIITFMQQLEKWLERETAISIANDKPDRIDRITDQCDCLRSTLSGASPSTAGELRSALDRIFNTEGNQVILSTIHRAKGLEWPVVVHLDPWRIPSKQARMAASQGNPAPLKQEYNLLYVAETRTKHTLINADMQDFK